MLNLKTIKKVELHRHLEGSFRFSTLVELAKAAKVDLPYHNFSKLFDSLIVHKPMPDLNSVLVRLLTAQKLLTSEEVWERITFEACEDAFNEGIVLLELRYSPEFGAMGHSHMTYDKIHKGILKGIDRAQKTYPMAVGLIALIGRILPMDVATRVANFIIANKDTILAIDLADNEEGFDCKPFSPLFEKAKNAGLKITVHAGEIPTGAYGVKDSIELLHADRIGHGVQIYRYPDLIELVKSKNVTLELCPLSNYLTSAIPNVKEHPFKQLLQKGVRVTINSDDPGLFGSSILDDYRILETHHGLTFADFNKCNQYAYEACYISEKIKSKIWYQ
jgi:adenosine deaminase